MENLGVPTALVLQLLFTTFLAGLSWFVQLVHYPLFYEVPSEIFTRYSSLHQHRTSCVVVPSMLGEMVTGIWLLIVTPLSPILIVLSALLLLNWILTGAFAVPLHRALSKKKLDQTIGQLIVVHWFRTVFWSSRVVLLGFLLLAKLEKDCGIV